MSRFGRGDLMGGDIRWVVRGGGGAGMLGRAGGSICVDGLFARCAEWRAGNCEVSS